MIHDVGFESITLDPKAEVKPSPQIEPTGELSLTAATMEVQKPVSSGIVVTDTVCCTVLPVGADP